MSRYNKILEMEALGFYTKISPDNLIIKSGSIGSVNDLYYKDGIVGQYENGFFLDACELHISKLRNNKWKKL